MKQQQIDIYIVESLAGYRLAVCLSRQEAQDAKKYYTGCFDYSPKSIVIKQEHAYQNGFHRKLQESFKETQEIADQLRMKN